MCDNSTNNTIYEDTCVPIVPTRTAQNICSNGTYISYFDNNTTGLAATYSLASQANTAAANAQSTADSKISKNATFSTNTQTGYIVLTDGDTTKNVVALADIKGEKGDKGCNSFSVAPNPGQSSETAVAYDIICND